MLLSILEHAISTISILWFAGAPAMAGLLSLVPATRPGTGWPWRGRRPPVLVFAAVAFLVTWIFDADVDAQARELLRRAEPDRSRRTRVHVG